MGTKIFVHANGVMVVRAYTSSNWWHELIVPNAETIVFPKGKTKFIRPDGTIGKEPRHGIAFVGMGPVANEALKHCGLGWFVRLRQSAHSNETEALSEASEEACHA